MLSGFSARGRLASRRSADFSGAATDEDDACEDDAYGWSPDSGDPDGKMYLQMDAWVRK
jgi:hypothetical protein